MPASVTHREEQVEKVPIKTISKGLIQCEECKSNPSKYKCPGCSIQSCSLPCVKAHKLRTGCTGKRNQTQFDVKRVAEAASRTRSKLGIYTNFKLPHYLKSLQNAARSRRTQLLFLPNGMSKREKNRSQFDHRKKSINWTIEWRFHSTSVVLHDHGVNENTSFCSILEKHFKPDSWNHQLKEFYDDQLDHLKLFIRKYPKGPKSPFKELDMKAPIKQQLENVVILEYPVVFVFLPSHSINFEVIKAVNPSIPKSPPKDSEINLIPEDVSFREEVIEDDNNSDDPNVFDLMKHEASSSSHQVLTENTNSANVPNDSLDIPLFEGDIEGNLSQSSPINKELELPEDVTFDFEQDFMDDAYADLMCHLNPEEFLDFDSVFANGDGNEIDLLPTIEELSVPEELEEGEIQE
ncbi:hypothetical protein TSUD_82230 [Trifolium subterraneum]|uniref:Box C/D snoRNA protein 1 n=1 Tax=Trifolium subterraneum TaxID=3900 RepID=A0A2Z6PIK7_TRISU|nr:hypothetical protein TSUD_82230 [Trifolium subterraneum]